MYRFEAFERGLAQRVAAWPRRKQTAEVRPVRTASPESLSGLPPLGLAPASVPDRKPRPRHISELKSIHGGEDIWVLGAGPSIDYVEPAFFANKVTIGVNEIYQHVPVTYLVRKELANSEAALASGIPVIVSEYDCGKLHRARNQLPGEYFYFPHATNRVDRPIDLDVIGTDRIVVSWSTLTSALHIAAYMGAANIMVCGHDCGVIDGRANISGYHATGAVEVPFDDAGYRAWLAGIEHQTIAVRERLAAVYGVRIHSLNPFINLHCEGHQVSR
ncbi:MAG: hypothetical protein ACREA0_07370 [bacterium]